MNQVPIRVKLDFTNLNLIEYNHVWFPVRMCSFSKIADVKSNICEKYCLPFDEIELFVKGALLREDETILLLRENDSIQVMHKNYKPCSIDSGAEAKKKTTKRRCQSNSVEEYNDKEPDVLAEDFSQNSCSDFQNHVELHNVSLGNPEHSTLVSDSVPIAETHHKKKKHKRKKQDDENETPVFPATEPFPNTSQPSTSKTVFPKVGNNAETGEPCYRSTKMGVGKETQLTGDHNSPSSSAGDTKSGKAFVENMQCLSPMPSKINSFDNGECRVNNSGDSVNLDTTNCPKKKRRRRRKRRSTKIEPEVIEDLPDSKPTLCFIPSSTTEFKNKHIRFEGQTLQSPCNNANKENTGSLIYFTSETSPCKNGNSVQLSAGALNQTPEQSASTLPCANDTADLLSTSKEISDCNIGIKGSTQKKSNKTTPDFFSRRHNLCKQYVSQTLEYLRKSASAVQNGNVEGGISVPSPEASQSVEVNGSPDRYASKQNSLKPTKSSSSVANGVSPDVLMECQVGSPSIQDLLPEPIFKNTPKQLAKNFQLSQSASMEPEDTQEQCQHKDYSAYPSLCTIPPVGTHIAFKLLELSELYCPEISDYKEGCIVGLDSDDFIKIKLVKEELKKPKRGKFENLYESDPENEEVEIVKTVTHRWTELIEPRLLSALTGQ